MSVEAIQGSRLMPHLPWPERSEIAVFRQFIIPKESGRPDDRKVLPFNDQPMS